MTKQPETSSAKQSAKPLITADEALAILQMKRPELLEQMQRASRIRETYYKNEVAFCGILNGKSGNCPENCAFCAQSLHHQTKAPKYPLMDKESIFKRAEELKSMGARAFSIVNSGRRLEDEAEIQTICNAIGRIRRELQMECCASLGRCTKDVFKRLKEAGVCRYHHNLETARSYFTNIVTSYRYDESIATIKNAQEAGMKICCCGIFGLGETDEQIVEFIQTLKELAIDGLPVNFLNPSEGTPLGNSPLLTIDKALAIIVCLRLTMPDKDIIIAGGRSVILQDAQYDIFQAGANAMMVGEYLTTFNSPWLEDLQAIEKQGLVLRKADPALID